MSSAKMTVASSDWSSVNLRPLSSWREIASHVASSMPGQSCISNRVSPGGTACWAGPNAYSLWVFVGLNPLPVDASWASQARWSAAKTMGPMSTEVTTPRSESSSPPHLETRRLATTR